MKTDKAAQKKKKRRRHWSVWQTYELVLVYQMSNCSEKVLQILKPKII